MIIHKDSVIKFPSSDDLAILKRDAERILGTREAPLRNADYDWQHATRNTLKVSHTAARR